MCSGSASADDVSKNPRCSHIGTGTSTFDNQRLFEITICVELNGIVLARKVGKVMLGPDVLKAD